jgi:hypothetical protein
MGLEKGVNFQDPSSPGFIILNQTLDFVYLFLVIYELYVCDLDMITKS